MSRLTTLRSAHFDALDRQPRRSKTKMPRRTLHSSPFSRTCTFWRAVSLVVLALSLCSIPGALGAYRGRSTASRRISGRGLGPRPADRFGVGKRRQMLETRSPFKLARRLLADEAQNFGNETLGDENGHCVTAWEHLRRRPELSVLFDIVETLPIIKSKMQDPSKVFTLFVPTNDAIESLKNWEGWLEMKNHLVEAFGSKRAMRAYLLAYHAVANETLTFSELKSLKGDDVYLEDLLNNIFPLRVNNTSSDGAVYIDGLGSTAKIIEPDIYACRAILHAVDTVLLPFDGDDQLDEEQVAMMRDATRAIAKRYNLDVPEPVDANADGRIDPYESVGAVPIESVPSDWTQGANETARR